MLNDLNICGRLVNNPELKTTANGRNITSFPLAVDRDYTVNGERKTDFFTVVAWNKTADFVTRFFTKGKSIIINGHLQTRIFDDKNGQKRVSTEIVADTVYFAGDKERTPAGENSSLSADDFEELSDDDDLPF